MNFLLAHWKKPGLTVLGAVAFFQFSHHNKIEPGNLAVVCLFIVAALSVGYDRGHGTGRKKGREEAEDEALREYRISQRA